MPIIIDGYVTVSTRKLRDHEGHHLSTGPDESRIALWCVDEQVLLEAEPAPSTRLYCGCEDQAEHDDGIAIQKRLRRSMRIPRSTCVGCYVGDDGPSVHSCAIHPVGDA